MQQDQPRENHASRNTHTHTTMRPTQVGPGRNNYVPKKDAGKFAPAADTKGFRMTNTAVGPQASGTEFTATQDPGKQHAAAHTAGYRMANTAVGPQASGTEYTATLDPGKQLPAGDNKY